MTGEDDFEFAPPYDEGYPECKLFLVAAVVTLIGVAAFFISVVVYG
jgi:hypothetical protein